ncbi:unnamed protein product [Anisakis simplex]|uniref:Pecanex-like protein n=1 Tax=Anisakis simplex TaxID=6269 RepID=A0A0M3J974_ANISI|nr:unnamed protein product [Anisakis simplex]
MMNDPVTRILLQSEDGIILEIPPEEDETQTTTVTSATAYLLPRPKSYMQGAHSMDYLSVTDHPMHSDKNGHRSQSVPRRMSKDGRQIRKSWLSRAHQSLSRLSADRRLTTSSRGIIINVLCSH